MSTLVLSDPALKLSCEGGYYALRLINLGSLRPEHFESRMGYSGHGVFLTREGRDIFARSFAAWDNVCDDLLVPAGGRVGRSPASLVQHEIERFLRAARERSLADFVPYYWRPQDIPSPA
jgi:hypothetical protein